LTNEAKGSVTPPEAQIYRLKLTLSEYHGTGDRFAPTGKHACKSIDLACHNMQDAVKMLDIIAKNASNSKINLAQE